MVSLLRQQALLVIVAALLFFPNLGNYALFDNDEAKTAGGAAEMFRHGAWIVPTFNDRLFDEQPILIFWMMLTSFTFFGVNEFAARLPSSVLAVATTLMTYHLGRKLYSAEAGFLSALVLCTSLWFSGFGRAATADSAQVFFVTLAFTSYVWVIAMRRSGNFNGPECPEAESPEAPEASPPETQTGDPAAVTGTSPTSMHPELQRLVPRNWKLAVPLFVALGLAVLALGLVGFILPYLAILLFLLMSLRDADLEAGTLKRPEGRRFKRGVIAVIQTLRPRSIIAAGRGMSLLIGFGIVAAIALPWYLAVGVQTNGSWLRSFFWDHGMEQAFRLDSGRNALPFYALYYLLVLPFGLLPWSVFLPVATSQLGQRLQDDEKDVFRGSDLLLVCWIAVWFTFFSLDGSRQSNYMLPIYPAIAVLLGRYFRDWQRQEGDEGVYSFNLCCKTLAGVGAVMMLGLYVISFLYFPNAQWIGLAGAIPMIAAFVAIKFLDQDQRHRVMQTLFVSSGLLAFVLTAIAPVPISSNQDSPQFVADARRLAGSHDVDIATFDHFEPSLVFYAGKPVTQLKDARQVADFLAGRQHAYVITKASRHNELRDVLTGDITELAKHRNFRNRYELILLGRN